MKRIVFALALLITSWSFASLTDGLVGYWPFDGDAKDYSGNSNHGSIYGVTSTNDRHGNSERAYCFNGCSYIYVANAPSINGISSEITIAVWIKPTAWFINDTGDASKFITIMQKANTSTCQYQFQFGVSTNNIKRLYLDFWGEAIIMDVSPPTLGQWQFVALTFSNGSMKYYKNGLLSDSKNVGVSLAPNDGPLYIGMDPVERCEYLIGSLDELSIYNQALSASEISALYNDGLKVCKITFNANADGVEGNMPSLSVLSDTRAMLPANGFRRQDGYVFQGWATTKSDADNGIVTYQNEVEIAIDHDMPLYAVWKTLLPPTLSVETADWTLGRITLRCGEIGMGVADAPFYTLAYFDTAKGQWLDIDRDDLLIPSPAVETNADGVEALITKITDREFARRNNGVGTVRYRVRDESGRVSAECVTRTRYGMFVAIGEYADSRINTLKVPALECALFKIAYMQYGQGTGMCQTLADKKSTRSGILLELEKMADRVPPGDIFLFYFAGHGGTGYMLCHDYNREKETGKITAEDLYTCFGKFCDGVGLISMIACCHSASMFIQDNGSMNLGRVGWILSSQTDEITYDNSIISIICNDGWIDGKADVKNGEYGRGDGDGYVTFWELAIYGYDFTGKNGYYGYRQHMDKANDFILDNIIVGKVPSNGAEVRALKWLAQSAPSYISSSADGDVMKTMAMTAANGCRTVGECYALGINPEDPNDDLKITGFEMKDGKPTITLNHYEDGSGESFRSRIKILGKTNLKDAAEEWREVPEGGDASLRFFKAVVEMP